MARATSQALYTRVMRMMPKTVESWDNSWRLAAKKQRWHAAVSCYRGADSEGQQPWRINHQVKSDRSDGRPAVMTTKNEDDFDLARPPNDRIHMQGKVVQPRVDICTWEQWPWSRFAPLLSTSQVVGGVDSLQHLSRTGKDKLLLSLSKKHYINAIGLPYC